MMNLSDLPLHVSARIAAVEDQSTPDLIAQRLRILGFVHGETVKLVARGPIAAEPLLIQIGYTRFALRRAEAQRVQVVLEEAK